MSTHDLAAALSAELRGTKLVAGEKSADGEIKTETFTVTNQQWVGIPGEDAKLVEPHPTPP
ncbi:MAG: hypothetical protein WA383_00675, partial [Terriglobales bacterium]